MTEWEDVAIPAGSFVGWGNKPEQHVTGRVIEYSIDGGTDYAGNKCPILAIELTEKASSFNKEGVRTDIEAGEIVQITCGQVKLKAGVRRADPSPGDLMKIELTNVSRTSTGNTLKDFGIKIARGAASKPTAAETDDDLPPF
jgi:hypothetical protein